MSYHGSNPSVFLTHHLLSKVLAVTVQTLIAKFSMTHRDLIEVHRGSLVFTFLLRLIQSGQLLSSSFTLSVDGRYTTKRSQRLEFYLRWKPECIVLKGSSKFSHPSVSPSSFWQGFFQGLFYVNLRLTQRILLSALRYPFLQAFKVTPHQPMVWSLCSSHVAWNGVVKQPWFSFWPQFSMILFVPAQVLSTPYHWSFFHSHLLVRGRSLSQPTWKLVGKHLNQLRSLGLGRHQLAFEYVLSSWLQATN